MAGTLKAGSRKNISWDRLPMGPYALLGEDVGGLTSCFLYISHTWWYLMGNRTKRWGLGMRRGSSSSAAERVGRVRAIAFCSWIFAVARPRSRALCSGPVSSLVKIQTGVSP
jgi:hypothetical protein